MHQIHTTPGFIIDSRTQGEAGRYLAIFTRDLGLVWAMAQGIRLEKSKLRGHTNEYSFGTFSFVRGKEVWRLTSAEDIGMTPAHHRELWAHIALLLKRLLHGEEANPELFEALISCYTFLNSREKLLTNNTEVSKAFTPNLDAIESLLVIRIMHRLGYIGDDKEIHQFVFSNDFEPALIDLAGRKRVVINQHINNALKESHL
jgi:recombinational DNA repair protein (RecF pathway)